MSSSTLHIAGRCAEGAVELSFDDCAALPAEHQIEDIGSLLPGREGQALRFRALAERVRPEGGVRYVHVASSDGGFTASLDYDQLVEHGLVLYGLEGDPLPETYGGPFRLFVAEAEDCSVNVKFLGSVVFAAEEGSHTARCADD